MKSIKNACQDHYQEQPLSDAQIDKLKALQQSQNPRNHSTSLFSTSKSSGYFALAASLFFIAIASWLINGNQNQLAEQVAAEIAYNHSKRMALEISSNELGLVKEHLSKLDFNLIESDKAEQGHWDLLGGRYCSIQGKLAAQLRVKQNNSNGYHTFYQAIIPDDLDLNNKTYSTWVEGTRVELWIEDGVLLGLAGEATEDK